MRLDWRTLTLLGAAFVLGGCWDFHPDVAEGPSSLPLPRLVSVTVQYRQPNGCLNVVNPSPCENRVVFFGSWMRPGGEILLTASPGSFVWTGVATGVPVNFPPGDQPHLVRVFDPHLIETPTGGVTAARLVVGGALITQFDEPGTPKESGLVYVDDNGVGHNPF